MCPQLICIIGFGRLEARHVNDFYRARAPARDLLFCA